MPKIVDHEHYRKDLLVRSFDLFAQKGYAAITIRQIAEGLGVSTGTLYHYFPSKQAIFEQMVEEMAQRDMAEAMVELAAAHTLRDRLQIAFAYVERKFDYFFKQNVLYIDFYQHQNRMSSQGEGHPSTILQRVCQELLTSFQELMGIQDPDLAAAILAMIDGLLFSKVYGDSVDFKSQAKLLFQMLDCYLKESLSQESLSQIVMP